MRGRPKIAWHSESVRVLRLESWGRRLWPLACLLGWAVVAPAGAAPAIHVVEEESIVLQVRPLTAPIVGGARDATLEIDDASVGEAQLTLRWPDPQSSSRLRLRASL